MGISIQKRIALILSLFLFSGAAFSKNPATGIFVDKAKNELHVANYVNDEFQVVKTYHTTLGKIKGDKETEGDQKTPEGIYRITSCTKPPQLQAKFGVMGFNLDYPNAFDQLAGSTGSHIMLHATNTPERLKLAYDSEGCVVVENKEIEEISKFVRIGLTPVLIYAEFKTEYLKPLEAPGAVTLKTFFETWVKNWEEKNLEGYMNHYHSGFSAQGKDFAGWKAYKGSLNKQYKSIQVGPEEVKYYRHPKYSMITFTQNYRSALNKGGVGHKSRGTKILFIAEEDGHPKIISETYTTVMW